MIEVVIFKNKNGKNEGVLQKYVGNKSELLKLKHSDSIIFKERVFLERKSPDESHERFESFKENNLVQYRDGNIPVINEKGYATRRFLFDFLKSKDVNVDGVLTNMDYQSVDLTEAFTYGEFAYILREIFDNQNRPYSKDELRDIEITNEFKISIILDADLIVNDLSRYRQQDSYKDYWVGISTGARAIPYPVYKAYIDFFADKSLVGEVPREVVVKVIEDRVSVKTEDE